MNDAMVHGGVVIRDAGRASHAAAVADGAGGLLGRAAASVQIFVFVWLLGANFCEEWMNVN